jgi:hypothetical protein
VGYVLEKMLSLICCGSCCGSECRACISVYSSSSSAPCSPPSSSSNVGAAKVIRIKRGIAQVPTVFINTSMPFDLHLYFIFLLITLCVRSYLKFTTPVLLNVFIREQHRSLTTA